ncbi:hypothetical protein ACG74X_19155 [Marivita sp. S0852]|uniref:hypothetical protein n=1 Tax=Marivita sp. S0852 TaxID=3373893 RepID=UPI0039824C4D
MDEKDPLARKLAALTSDDTFDGKALHLGRAGASDSMTLLLQAIDDTMLERDALFSVGNSSATLRISGKRVQMLVAATDDLTAPAELIGAPIDAEKPQAMAQLGSVLNTLLSREGTLTVERQRVSGAGTGLGSGVSIRTLKANWSSEQVQDDKDPMTEFLDRVTPLAITMIALKEWEIDSVTGDPEAIGNLEAILDSGWKAFDHAHGPFLSEDQSAHMRLLDQWGADGQSTLVAVIGDRQCLALVRTEDAAQILTAWQSALR